MSRLVNQNWINFNGEPVTGRTPPSVIVYGPPMTAQQQGEVAHAYKLFTDANLVSLGGYQVRNRTLSDGTRVRMLSINGVDTVQVWTSAKEEDEELKYFEGFVLLPFQKMPTAISGQNHHYIWGAPFNLSNDFYGARRETYHHSRWPLFSLEVDAKTLFRPVTKPDTSLEWEYYRAPKFKKWASGQIAGNIDWIGPEIKRLSKYPVLTFRGAESRHFPYDVTEALRPVNFGVSAMMDDFFSPEIYFRGDVLGTLPCKVQGAALRVFDGALWLVVAGVEVSSSFTVQSQTGLNTVEVVWVYERIYIKRVSLDRIAKDKSDSGLYHPTTKPRGWKLLAERAYIAQDHAYTSNGYDTPIELPDGTIYSSSVHPYKQPWHNFFFNQGGTECVASIRVADTLRNFGGSTGHNLVKWSITNEGYASTATFSVIEENTDVIAADYVNNVMVSASMVTAAVGGNDYTFQLGDTEFTIANTECVLYIDPRYKLMLYKNYDASGKYVRLRHNAADSLVMNASSPAATYSYFDQLYRSPYTEYPRTNIAVYKGHCVLGFEEYGTPTPIPVVYFKVNSDEAPSELRQHIGGENLPVDFGLAEVRII